MLTDFGTKLFFFMSDPKQVSRQAGISLLYRMLLWQLHLEWRESLLLSVRNRLHVIVWLELKNSCLFTFQVRYTYTVEGSAILTA